MLRQLLQILLVLCLCLSLFFLYYCVRHRDKRGALPLAILFFGIVIWVGSELLQIQLYGEHYAGVGMALRLLGIELGVIGVFLLSLEYTGREEWINWRTGALLAVVPAVEVTVALSPWRTVLFETVPATGTLWGYEIVTTPLFLLHAIYSYTIISVTVFFLVGLMVRTGAAYRRQLFAVFVAVIAPLIANVLFNVGLIPFDITPVSFVVTASVLLFATFRLRLLDTIPVARRTVLEQMDELVIVLDEEDRILTTNGAVKDFFDIDAPIDGEPVTRLFGEQVVGLPDTDGQHEIELVVDGSRRTITVTASTITDYRDNILARVLVCRDVTEQKRREKELRQREQELELLKDLQSRFLRHNLRNELNVVRANAELLAEKDDPAQRAHYEKIVEKTDRILDWSTKARTIERLLETDELVNREITSSIEQLVADLEADYPAVAFTVRGDTDLWIRAVSQVERALWNVLDNAARYNDGNDPQVVVTAWQDGDCVVVTISDNGPGLAQQEIETIEDESETPLQHGTGLGLWLVYWVVQRSNGSLSFDSNDGTTVILEFDAGEATTDGSTMSLTAGTIHR